ncbi:hypothetical protein [Paenibacillus methanolicus]|uniref:Uncharacterized protein n=1 Tax=Paenibacillus methanolicus TaxID=582686 RepID=A0A5S5BTZ1_9BACL|nr:hypothetical protein [Paenibacillus methanolicus]TYP70641.1 hypothetical protein BCM02_111147 [Paenibacillus methanolicus]
MGSRRGAMYAIAAVCLVITIGVIFYGIRPEYRLSPEEMRALRAEYPVNA